MDLVHLSAENLLCPLTETSPSIQNESSNSQKCDVRIHSSERVTATGQVNFVLCVTSMKDLMEKRLASMVDRPWARQLWAMKPALSSARQIASSPSFQFQLGMFSRWAFITRQADRRGQEKEMVIIFERVTSTIRDMCSFA